MYQTSQERVKAIIENQADLPLKSKMVNDRITEIERNLLELLHEKKKCIEYQEMLRSQCLKVENDIMEEIDKEASAKYEEVKEYIEEPWKYQKT